MTGVELTAGRISAGQRLELTIEGEHLVCFADGIESDHLALAWGQRVRLAPAEQHLTLVTAA